MNSIKNYQKTIKKVNNFFLKWGCEVGFNLLLRERDESRALMMRGRLGDTMIDENPICSFRNSSWGLVHLLLPDQLFPFCAVFNFRYAWWRPACKKRCYYHWSSQLEKPSNRNQRISRSVEESNSLGSIPGFSLGWFFINRLCSVSIFQTYEMKWTRIRCGNITVLIIRFTCLLFG